MKIKEADNLLGRIEALQSRYGGRSVTLSPVQLMRQAEGAEATAAILEKTQGGESVHRSHARELRRSASLRRAGPRY